MPFLLRGKAFALFNSDKLEVNETIPAIYSDKLFAAILDLPLAEANPEDIEKSNHPLDQSLARGVMEKSYVVVVPEQKNGIYIAGTDNLYSCLGISFYGKKTGKLIIAHFDMMSSGNNIKNIFAEFSRDSEIQIRFFGGLSKDELYGYDISDSIEKAKEIFLNVYEYAYKSDVVIDILSANIFEKLREYRDVWRARNLSTSVGFALDCKTGKVLAFLDPFFEEWLPYTSVDNCGIFSGKYKQSRIWLRMRNLWGNASDEVQKVYDGEFEELQDHLKADWNKKSYIGIINVLIRLLRTDYISTTLGNQDKELFEYLNKNLQGWLDDYDNGKKSCFEHLLEFVRSEIEGTSEENFINELYKSKLLHKWYYSNLHIFIKGYLKSRISDEFIYRKFCEKLDGLQSYLNLTREFSKYQRGMDTLESAQRVSNTLRKSLFFSVTLCKSEQDMMQIMDGWYKALVSQRCERICQDVFEQLKKQYGKSLPSQDEPELYQLMVTNFIQKPTNMLDLIHETSGCYILMEQQLAEYLASKISRLSCCVRVIDDHVASDIGAMLDKWLAQYSDFNLIKSFDIKAAVVAEDSHTLSI